jgi:NitT/TauT family transport system substrate-binding protein
LPRLAHHQPGTHRSRAVHDVPPRYRERVDVRLFWPGERVAFLPYSRDMFESTQRWIHERDMFETAPAYDYDAAMSGR